MSFPSFLFIEHCEGRKESSVGRRDFRCGFKHSALLTLPRNNPGRTTHALLAQDKRGLGQGTWITALEEMAAGVAKAHVQASM